MSAPRRSARVKPLSETDPLRKAVTTGTLVDDEMKHLLAMLGG